MPISPHESAPEALTPEDPQATASSPSETNATSARATVESVETESPAPTPESAPLRAAGPVLLDPSYSRQVPLTPPRARRRARRRLVGRIPSRVLYGGLLGGAGLVVMVALGLRLDTLRRSGDSPADSTGLSALRSAPELPGPTAAAVAAPESPAEAGPWRVNAWAGDPAVRLIQGKIGEKSLLDALTDEHVPKAQVFRILKAFDDPKRFDRPRKNDSYVVALDRGTKRVKGFEYQTSIADVWQAREGEDGRLVGTKLDLHVLQQRVAKAVVVTDDVKSAVVAAGFDDDILDALDDALEDRVALGNLHRGAALRIVAQEQTVLGKFARYVDVEAVEYTPAKADAVPVRVYHYKNGKNTGYYDMKGHAPYKGGWRHPVKFPRVTSRYNPKRMHPVLHVVMPHNGCDFGASTGTPVYAASSGTIANVGPQGPSGNLVLINHSAGYQTGYAHLSRFAPGLKTGDKVETRQLVGYVGSTGRSTGAHLHFSLKKNGVFVDPLSLKLDGERVLPREERDAFDALRAALDGVLESIPRPERPADLPPTTDDEDAINDEEGDGPSVVPSATPSAPTPPATLSAAPRDTSVDSAVWRP